MTVRSVTILLIASLFAVYIMSCDAPHDDGSEGIPVPTFISATPPGGEIAADAIITVTFPNAPENVTVSAGVATVSGKSVKISGPFPIGPLALTIFWEEGTLVLYYTVVEPDTEAPKVTGGTIVDGDIDVDQDEINSDAKIVITFNESIHGDVALQTEDVGWIGKVNWERQVILELVRGKEPNCGTTYIVVGKVSDDFENSTDFKVTFSTKGCDL